MSDDAKRSMERANDAMTFARSLEARVVHLEARFHATIESSIRDAIRDGHMPFQIEVPARLPARPASSPTSDSGVNPT